MPLNDIKTLPVGTRWSSKQTKLWVDAVSDALGNQGLELQAIRNKLLKLEYKTPSPARFRVHEIFPDFLRCRFIQNGEEVQFDTYIAKPDGDPNSSLQTSQYDDISAPDHDAVFFTYANTDTQERTKTRDSDSTAETQVIVPRYLVTKTIDGTEYDGSIITADFQIGGTGLFLTTESSSGGPTATGTQASEPIVWIDMNLQGRAWAKKSGT